ncbi:hypothetical protein IAE22_34355, partial [Bacillus sp. S34]|nr:hypothetical protein [Bacillus sp. S34]
DPVRGEVGGQRVVDRVGVRTGGGVAAPGTSGEQGAGDAGARDADRRRGGVRVPTAVRPARHRGRHLAALPERVRRRR